jgi:hypothetical protein
MGTDDAQGPPEDDPDPDPDPARPLGDHDLDPTLPVDTR